MSKTRRLESDAEMLAWFEKRCQWYYTDLVRVSAERDEAVAKQRIDEAQCDDMTATAARLAEQLSQSEARERALREALEGAIRLAKEAVNSWACGARSNREHDTIVRLHGEIDALAATK
jgi:hypothetical protein